MKGLKEAETLINNLTFSDNQKKTYMLYENVNEKIELLLENNDFVQLVLNENGYTLLKGKCNYIPNKNKILFKYDFKAKNGLEQELDNKELYDAIYKNNELSAVFINNKELTKRNKLLEIDAYIKKINCQKTQYFRYLGYDKNQNETYRQEIVLYSDNKFEEFIGVKKDMILFSGNYDIDYNKGVINMHYLYMHESNEEKTRIDEYRSFKVNIKNISIKNIDMRIAKLESVNEKEIEGMSYFKNNAVQIEKLLGTPIINRIYMLSDRNFSNEVLEKMIEYTDNNPNISIKLSNCIIDGVNKDYIDISRGIVSESVKRIK